MKKQYCLEWYTKNGRDGFKSLGYDLTEQEVEKEMMKKLKQKSTASVAISWNYVGSDVPEELAGDEWWLMGGSKRKFEVFGNTVYVDNDYQIWRANE